MRLLAVSGSFSVTAPATGMGLALKAGQIMAARVLHYADGQANLVIGQWGFAARLETTLPESAIIYLQIKEISPEKVIFRLLGDTRPALQQNLDLPGHRDLFSSGLSRLFRSFINPLAPKDEIVKDLRKLFSTPLAKLLNSPETDAVNVVKALQILNDPTAASEDNGITIFIPVALQDQVHDVYLTIQQDHEAETNPAPVRVFCSLKTANLGVITIEAVLFGKTIDCFLHGSLAFCELAEGRLTELQDRLGALGFSPRHCAVSEREQLPRQPLRLPRLSVDFRL